MHQTIKYLEVLDRIDIVCDGTIFDGFDTAWAIRLIDLVNCVPIFINLVEDQGLVLQVGNEH